jgi:5'-3' exoribonuclease 2
MAPLAAQALAGSNRDVVANRRAIRMANMSAAEVLKAELAGLQPVKPSSSSLPPKPVAATSATTQIAAQLPAKPMMSPVTETSTISIPPTNGALGHADDMEVDEFGRARRPEPEGDAVAGHKRPFEEGPGAPDVEDDVVTVEENDDDPAPGADPLAYKVNADGTVTQEDTVK